MLELTTLLNTNFAQNSVSASLVQMKTFSDCTGLVQSFSAISDEESAAFIECVANIASNEVAAPAHDLAAAVTAEDKKKILEVTTEENLVKVEKIITALTDVKNAKNFLRLVYALFDDESSKFNGFAVDLLIRFDALKGDTDKIIDEIKKATTKEGQAYVPTPFEAVYNELLLVNRNTSVVVRYQIFNSIIKLIGVDAVTALTKDMVAIETEVNKKVAEKNAEVAEAMKKYAEEIKDKDEMEQLSLTAKKMVELVEKLVVPVVKEFEGKIVSAMTKASEEVSKQLAKDKDNAVALKLTQSAIEVCKAIKSTDTEIMAKYAKASKNTAIEKNIEAYKKVCSEQKEVTAYLQKVYKAMKNEDKLDLEKVDFVKLEDAENVKMLNKDAALTEEEIKGIYNVMLKNSLLNSGFQASMKDPEFVLTDNVEGKTAEGFESESSSDSKLWLWVILAVVGVAAVGGGAYFFMSKKKKQNTLMN